LSELTPELVRDVKSYIAQEIKYIAFIKSTQVDPECIKVYSEGMNNLITKLKEHASDLRDSVRIEVLSEPNDSNSELYLSPPQHIAYIKVAACAKGPNKFVRLNTVHFGTAIEDIALLLLRQDSSFIWPFVRNTTEKSFKSVSILSLPWSETNFMTRFWAGLKHVNECDLDPDFARMIAEIATKNASKDNSKRGSELTASLNKEEMVRVLSVMGFAGDIYGAVLRTLYTIALDVNANRHKQYVYPNPRLMLMHRDNSAPRKTEMHGNQDVPTAVQVRYYMANPYLPPRLVHNHNKHIGHIGQRARKTGIKTKM
jgi:hypothetical protein